MTHVEAVAVVKRLKRVLLAWLSWKEVLKEVWWKMEFEMRKLGNGG